MTAPLVVIETPEQLDDALSDGVLANGMWAHATDGNGLPTILFCTEGGDWFGLRPLNEDDPDKEKRQGVLAAVDRLPLPLTILAVEGRAIAQEASGASAIASERARQIAAEGYTPEHDAEHGWHVLVQAGVCYADHIAASSSGAATASWLARTHPFWPWDAQYWKPTPGDPRRQLVKAGALIAAAIDALDAQTGEPR